MVFLDVSLYGLSQIPHEFPIGHIADGTWAFIAHAVVGYSTDGGITFDQSTI